MRDAGELPWTTLVRKRTADVKRWVRFLPRGWFGLRHPLGRLTSRWRLSPSFILLGAQKAGTTSLFSYLMQTPGMAAPRVNEIHFFDDNYVRGDAWYRSFFPLAASLRHGGSAAFTGEKTPYYLFHPFVPERVARFDPSVKLIVLLRDPVERAYSHFRHAREQGFEPVTSFQEALDLEEERLEGATTVLADARRQHFSHQHHSYRARGVYIEQIRRWLEYFHRRQMLIVPSEDLFVNPRETHRAVCRFLGVDPGGGTDWSPRNTGGYGEKMGSVRHRLARYYEPHNRELYDFLGRELEWTRPGR